MYILCAENTSSYLDELGVYTVAPAVSVLYNSSYVFTNEENYNVDDAYVMWPLRSEVSESRLGILFANCPRCVF